MKASTFEVRIHDDGEIRVGRLHVGGDSFGTVREVAAHVANLADCPTKSAATIQRALMLMGAGMTDAARDLLIAEAARLRELDSRAQVEAE